LKLLETGVSRSESRDAIGISAVRDNYLVRWLLDFQIPNKQTRLQKPQQSMVCCIARQVALDIRGVDKNDFCGLGQFCVGTSWHELPVVLIGMSIATQGAELSSRRFGVRGAEFSMPRFA
jgi:hypothetical protein